LLIFGKAFWDRFINFNVPLEEGTISPEDLDLFEYVETAEEAWAIISGRLAESPASGHLKE